jgi:CRP-like cAMP-binding protein
MRDNSNLSPEQIDHVRSVAQVRSVRAGEVLYEPSQPDVPLFIVLEGSVSIIRTGEDDKILAVREANQFTGEMSVISGKRSLLKARVTGDGSLLDSGLHSCSRPACPESSLLAIREQAVLSALLRQSVKARWRCTSCIDTLPSAWRRLPTQKKHTCGAVRLCFDESSFR